MSAVVLARRSLRLAPLLQHGLLQQLEVHIVADVGEMPALLGAQQAARAAYLQVAHRYAEAGVELRKLAYGLQALLRDLAERLVAPEGEVGAGPPRAAADAAAQLVELGEAQAVGVLYYQRVDVGYVYASLDYRRADEDLYAAVGHVLHYPAQLLGVHLAVGHGDAAPSISSEIFLAVLSILSTLLCR